MAFTDILTGTIVFISVVGTILGIYATAKIYSKQGFR